jgi:hypothetical protein
MSRFLRLVKAEATAQYIAEPYVQRRGVSKERHLTTVREYVVALHLHSIS